ncbi:MAG: ATP-binding protein [Candidatus Micrarchaeia archaeon]
MERKQFRPLSTRPPSSRTSGFLSMKPQSQTSQVEEAEMLEIARTIYEGSAEGVFVCDFNGRFLNANPLVLSMLGISLEELRMRSFTDVIPPAQYPLAISSLREIIESGIQSGIRRFSLISSTGEESIVAAQASLLRRGDQPYAILGIVRDVTEYIHMQDELRRATALATAGTVARKAGHDLRNFLTIPRSLVSYLNEIDPDRLTPDRITVLKRIASSVSDSLDKVDKLIEEMMLISSPGLKNVDSVDVNPILNVLADSIRRKLSGSPLAYIVETELGSGLWNVRADRMSIERAFLNMLINAIDAMQDGGIISVRTENCEDSDGRFVKVTIADTGAGMPPEVLAKIFNPDFTTKGERGSGLGLAIASKSVSDHQGWIEVSSVPGHGSSFVIYLPAL